jgi:L-alanine-DL-glutamate epimerase-like enolase superfamily enzyme
MSMEMQLHRHTLTLSDPLRTAHGEISRREIVTVALRGRDGVTGWGECCPLEHYDGVSMERALLALSRHREVVEGWDSTPPPARNGRTARGGATRANQARSQRKMAMRAMRAVS